MFQYEVLVEKCPLTDESKTYRGIEASQSRQKNLWFVNLLRFNAYGGQSWPAKPILSGEFGLGSAPSAASGMVALAIDPCLAV